MKMAEPPAEPSTAEESPPVPNPGDDSLVEKAPVTSGDIAAETTVTENGLPDPESAPHEMSNDGKTHDGEKSKVENVPNVEDNGDKSENVQDNSVKQEDDKVDTSVKEIPEANTRNDALDVKPSETPAENGMDTSTSNGDNKTDQSDAKTESEVVKTEDETETSKTVTKDNQVESNEEHIEDKNNEEDISGLNEEQLRERCDSLQTKYSAAELQLDSLREQNDELRTKLQKMEEQSNKPEGSLSKSSSTNSLREKARQRDGFRVQADYLAHELSQQQDTEKYLREKVAEILEEKEESERKLKDLQLKLKRFVKDDQAKDDRLAKLEGELREVAQEIQLLESYLDEETLQKVRRNRSSSQRSAAGQNGEVGATQSAEKYQTSSSPTPQSKTCIIL